MMMRGVLISSPRRGVYVTVCVHLTKSLQRSYDTILDMAVRFIFFVLSNFPLRLNNVLDSFLAGGASPKPEPDEQGLQETSARRVDCANLSEARIGIPAHQLQPNQRAKCIWITRRARHDAHAGLRIPRDGHHTQISLLSEPRPPSEPSQIDSILAIRVHYRGRASHED